MNLSKCVSIFFLDISCMLLANVPLKPYEQWWEKNFENMMPSFMQWFGDPASSSRVKARHHIKAQKYKSILDIPCSFATEFYGFKQDSIAIDYVGIDISQQFVKFAQDKNIRAQQATIEAIPYPDSSFDICYARHILEHIAYYENAIEELIRVATYEVLIIFFIKPTDGADSFRLSYDHDCLLYGNTYNRHKLEAFVLNNSKTKYLLWEDVEDKEVILHIFLK